MLQAKTRCHFGAVLVVVLVVLPASPNRTLPASAAAHAGALVRNGKEISSAELTQMAIADGVKQIHLDWVLHGVLSVPDATGKRPGILVVGGYALHHFFLTKWGDPGKNYLCQRESLRKNIKSLVWYEAKRYHRGDGGSILKQKHLKTIIFFFLSIAASLSAAQHLDGAVSLRESLDDAWWTGPLYAISPETLSRGHYLIEPYVFSVLSNGARQYVSSNYIYYGLRDNFSLGVIPAVGSTSASGTNANSGWQMGDFTALAMLRLTEFNEHTHVPTIALEIQETFPTGKYDRLGNQASNGLSNGSYTTTLQANAQNYLWLPNGRILRTRLNLLGTISSTAAVSDKSIFATPEGFRGTAVPGSTFTGNIAWEYSITRHWVAALDVISQAKNTTRISGHVADPTQPEYAPSVLQFSSPASLGFQLAPAIEYNVSPNLGIIAGVGVALSGRNTSAGVVPMIAVNWYK